MLCRLEVMAATGSGAAERTRTTVVNNANVDNMAPGIKRPGMNMNQLMATGLNSGSVEIREVEGGTRERARVAARDTF